MMAATTIELPVVNADNAEVAKVRLPAGKHSLRFTNPQVGSVRHCVIVRAGRVTKVRLRLR